MDLLNDFRYAVRGLLKRPGLTAIAVLTLALGVGANTAIFSVVHGVLLRSLGFAAEHELYSVVSVNKTEGEARPGSSFPDYWYYKENQTSFSDLGFFAWSSMTREDPGHVEQLAGVFINADLFRTLGVEPQVGRQLTQGDATQGPGLVALVSDPLWQRLWNRSPSAVGDTLRLDGRVVTVVGVMPPETAMPSSGVDIWVPAGRFEQNAGRFDRDERDFEILGRLAPGATQETAQLEMDRLAEELATAYPETNGPWGVTVRPLRERLVGASKQPILIAFAAVALVLLLACANIAHLLLVRASGREREMAVRAALGAERWQLVGQVLLESLILALAGGIVGTLVAAWLHDLLLALDPGILPRADQIALDTPVLLFALAASLVTGVLCGLVPALRSSSVLFSALRSGRGHVGGRGGVWRQTMLAAEIALALVLLSGAGLLIRALYDLDQVDPGFRPDGTFTTHLILDGDNYDDPEKRIRYFRRLREKVEAIPGVQSAAVTTTPPTPYTGITIDVPYRGPNAPLQEDGAEERAAFRVIGPGYFDTIGIPRLQGRDFMRTDDGEAENVVIVNRTLAQRVWGDENPIGQRLEITFGNRMELEVVGVVGDTRFAGLHVPPRPALFLHHPQMVFRGMAVVSRTTLSQATYAESLRQAAAEIDPLLPPGTTLSLAERLERSIGLEKFFGVLLSIFAALALILAAAGIYGVFSYWVSQRTNEIGVRMALGARAEEIIRLVVHQGLVVAGVGLAAGLLGTLALSNVLRQAFQSVDVTHPIVLITVASALALVAVASCLVPALRASRIEPTTALRAE